MWGCKRGGKQEQEEEKVEAHEEWAAAMVEMMRYDGE
jgi:hypothetical protein